ncbi:MAG: hypothetical protein ACI9YH_003684, partial [Colwellia sp.]
MFLKIGYLKNRYLNFIFIAILFLSNSDLLGQL